MIYETACELNNKYDAKACARVIEEIKPEGVLATFARKCAFDTFDQLGEFVFESFDVIGTLGKRNQSTSQRQRSASEVRKCESVIS